MPQCVAMSELAPRERPLSRVAAAWAVHLYTASGLLAGAWIAVLIVRGGPAAFRAAFALMLLATFIDSTDGWLARRVRVKEVLPSFDGRRLDDIVDFQLYTSLPLLLLWRAGALGEWQAALLLPLLASAYGFCQTRAKTEDGCFLGFPSYWNFVALYLVALAAPPAGAAAVVAALAALTFVPSRYLYPSQPGRLNAAASVLALFWLGMLAGALWLAEGGDFSRPGARRLLLASLFYPVFYLGTSWALSLGRLSASGTRRPSGWS